MYSWKNGDFWKNVNGITTYWFYYQIMSYLLLESSKNFIPKDLSEDKIPFLLLLLEHILKTCNFKNLNS